MAGRAPSILGARGAPLEAPENTAAGFAAALGLGLDGVSAEVRACKSGELVVIADAELERTTDGRGAVADKDWTELADLDAGAAFHARFRGERLLLAEELLQLADAHGPATSLALRAEGADVAARLASLAREIAPHASVRIASAARDAVIAARDAGASAMAVAAELDERLLARVREDRPAALSAPLAAWTRAIAAQDWPVERWAFDVDAPADLLAACRAELHAFTTREPRRALAARTLVALAPSWNGAWPVVAPPLEVAPDPASALAGDWAGAWEVAATIANPFPFAVRARVGLAIRRGAFDVAGLPRALELGPGATETVAFALTGGARRPGGDPLLVARCAWARGPGRAAGELDLDAPLARVRTAVADAIPRRLVLLRDGPRERAATLVLRRRRDHVLVTRESPGPLADPRVVVRCAGATYRGARGVRVPLPADFDARAAGVPFSCGLEAWSGGERVERLWCGGLSDAPDAGAPGVLLPAARA